MTPPPLKVELLSVEITVTDMADN